MLSFVFSYWSVTYDRYHLIGIFFISLNLVGYGMYYGNGNGNGNGYRIVLWKGLFIMFLLFSTVIK